VKDLIYEPRPVLPYDAPEVVNDYGGPPNKKGGLFARPRIIHFHMHHTCPPDYYSSCNSGTLAIIHSKQASKLHGTADCSNKD
jgi:hypothetical protein